MPGPGSVSLSIRARVGGGAMSQKTGVAQWLYQTLGSGMKREQFDASLAALEVDPPNEASDVKVYS
jgi:hypothetical protein